MRFKNRDNYCINNNREGALMHALHKNFSVNYVLQPIVSKDGNITFFEILGRVKDENGNVQSVHPQIATKYTKMLIHYAYTLIDNGFVGNSNVTINLSTDEINEDIVDNLLFLFARKKVAHKVMIEVTEDVFIGNDKDELLVKLQNNGFKIALDDFCSEKSVRSLICDYDFIQTIKFDGVFMQNIKEGRDKLVDGLKHLVSFVKSLEKETVIEHIENKKLFETAKIVGADYLQGFYLGTPQPVEEYKGV
ncbi:cyclic diguanylate phosphodiesterase (plasmid) [Campylobacter iguaniorum]|uniref:Cyclic diguanylate phosphodiesterase n=1 Tax=Campylobacter iguaniorum TaxID=1244531 RepID=A0A076FD65_9BACT|nr:EAL domain-containing protein [Campylobacter iguaniorum]AII15598.1 cyclic diguanylate phosphodiesterase [Campylobacter iguaniorum]